MSLRDLMLGASYNTRSKCIDAFADIAMPSELMFSQREPTIEEVKKHFFKNGPAEKIRMEISSLDFKVCGRTYGTSIGRNIRYPIFRYTKRCYADAFFKTGIFYLSTLFDYHEAEIYPEAIHDDHEGLLRVHLPNDWRRCTVTAQNQWVLSCTAVRNDVRMMPEFEADCCFQINSPNFFEAIANGLEGIATSGIVLPIDYLPDDADTTSFSSVYGSTRFVGFRKQARYRWQREIRGVWENSRTYRPITDRPIEGTPDAPKDNSKRYFEMERARLRPIKFFATGALNYCTPLW